MDFEQLFEIARPSPILESERLLDAIQEKTTAKNIRYRGALCT